MHQHIATSYIDLQSVSFNYDNQVKTKYEQPNQKLHTFYKRLLSCLDAIESID